MKIVGNNYILNSIKLKKGNKSHYTPEIIVKKLMKFIPSGKSYLDAGSGKNKVWYNNFPEGTGKYECEIEDGKNFYDWTIQVDWVIGNPPYAEGWKFLEKATTIAREGIAFLGNINFFNSLTPNRLIKLNESGFYIQKIIVLSIPNWYGRYYFIIFERKINDFVIPIK